MVDLEILRLYGVSAEGLKKRFNKPRQEQSEKIQRLTERFRSRAQAGRDLNLETYQVFYAMDQAWDSCFKQITPTLLASLTDKDLSQEGIDKILEQWGLNPRDVIQEVADPKTPGKKINVVNAPAFVRIVPPLVLAYIKIRWARLTNDRKMIPLLKYSPVISDAYSRLKCDALTQRIEQMSRQMGYFETLKQEIFRVLLYGECIKFAVEEWYTECSIVEKDSPFKELEMVKIPVKGEEGLPDTEVEAKKIVVKEGLRYHLPHPTRTYYDRAHFPSTMNTDTGCKYAGYWKVVRWAQVMSTEGYYNLDIIGYEDFHKWFNSRRSHSYWKNVLNGCSMDFPDSTVSKAGGSLDSENHVANWYSKDMADKPIVITEHFEKLVPKDNDLGDYPYEVWFRFVLAADDTVIYAAPLPGVPMTWTGYDFAEGRTHNASMALEILPFQDQFSNLLTQMLLTTRQNLANVTLMDSDVFDQSVIDKIKGWGEQWYRNVVNLVPVSFKRAAGKQGSDLRQSVISHKFPLGNTSEMVQAMNSILDVLERVLVMSSQEVGQAASHEQTREEVKHISQNTSTRVTFTATGIDTSRDAWKKQLYVYLMAYGQDEFWAQVPMEEPIDEQKLAELGFTYASPYDDKTRKAHIKTLNKTAIAYESFASDRDGMDRVDDVETASAMTAFLEKIMANPDLYAALGVDQIIAILNQIARFAGFPRDFKLVNTGQTQAMRDEIMSAMQEMMGMLQQQIQQGDADIQGALQQITKKNNDQDMNLKDLFTKINKLIGEAQGIPDPMMAEEQTVPATPEDMQSILQVGGGM
jgi:hypothetical protein